MNTLLKTIRNKCNTLSSFQVVLYNLLCLIYLFTPSSVLLPLYRRGHDDLGDHYLDCGDLSNALKCYSRARDYCTSAKHVINMCLNVIKVHSLLLLQSCHGSSHSAELT